MESLPNELLDRIAFFLSLQNLGNFSLSCHRIRDVSLRHLFRRIRLTYGLSDEAIQESDACYSCYVQRAQHVRDIHLLMESKSFYHYNLQGSHGAIIQEALMPFGQAERLGIFEYSETSWADFFSVVKGQLETKPNLRYLGLQPNFIERAKEPRSNPSEKNEPWLKGSVPSLQSLRLSFLAVHRTVHDIELERVARFIDTVARFRQATDSVRKLILDGALDTTSRPTPLGCKPLSFPQLETLLARDLRLSGATVSKIVAPETLRNIRVHSCPRPENWRTETEILDWFLPFSGLEEVHLYHSHNSYFCSTCKDSHRIFHVSITAAYEDSKLLAQHLPRLEVVEWYSAYAPPLLLWYSITRSSDGSPNLTLKRSKFEKVESEVGFVCEDYQGQYPDLEILPCDDGGALPRINWQDLAWFEPTT